MAAAGISSGASSTAVDKHISTVEQEIAALSGCLNLLSPLDNGAQPRVLRYLASRLGIYIGD